MDYCHSLYNMKLDEIVAWYQKKIGTYDKQEWEKTVEQKILNSFTSITLKNAKLKTGFIDVDLVRGSSFPKAKPKQSLLTVIRLAILRYLFLPIYAKWWVAHTSFKLYFIFLILYIGQMFNWAIYMSNIHKIESNAEHIVSISELIIPMILSFILCLIHSLIVATNSLNSPNSKNKQLFNKNGKPREKIRRRKKLVRNIVHIETTADNNGLLNKNKKISDLIVNLNASSTTAVTVDSSSIIETMDLDDKQKLLLNQINNKIDENSEIIFNKQQQQQQIHHNYDLIDISSQKNDNDVQKKSLNKNDEQIEKDCNNSNVIMKKRNVNWDSPIHNYAINDSKYDIINFIMKESQSAPNIHLTTLSDDNDVITVLTTTTAPSDTVQNIKNFDTATIKTTIANTTEIDRRILKNQNQVKEAIKNSNNTIDNNNHTREISNVDDIESHVLEAPIEDDGFESLNGKSSSGEENKIKNDDDYDDDTFTKEFIYNKIEINSNDKIPLIQQQSNNNTQLRQRITFGKNRINNGNNEKLDDELSDEELYKSNFDKLNKRYSIPMMRNTRRKFQSSEPELNNRTNRSNESSDIDEEGDADEETVTSPTSLGRTTSYNGCSTSATEWLGITTNSEECSYSSEPNSDLKEDSDEISDHEFAPTVLLNSHGSNDIISCTIWDRHDPKKAEMSVLDISSCIIERVEAMPESSDYIYIGVVFSITLSLIPSFCRLCEATVNWETATEISYLDVPVLLWEKTSFSLTILIELAFGKSNWERIVLFLGFFQRLLLTFLLFFLFAVAERTFKQRFLYAKLFSHLTSSRRARKSDLPHFRLNKVRNIKTWLSVRSYLKRRGPQRSVDVIVSTAFSITLLLLGFLSVECLKDSVHIHSQLNLEALFWSGALGIYLLRFMTLGNKINRKYRSISVLITEQINLYLQIEQKPKKKDELMVANSVLKLAADLLKELESPFKISGLSANPYLFTTIKVVILSAFSGVLSEMLGFKLKLHKIKIK